MRFSPSCLGIGTWKRSRTSVARRARKIKAESDASARFSGYGLRARRDLAYDFPGGAVRAARGDPGLQLLGPPQHPAPDTDRPRDLAATVPGPPGADRRIARRGGVGRGATGAKIAVGAARFLRHWGSGRRRSGRDASSVDRRLKSPCVVPLSLLHTHSARRSVRFRSLIFADDRQNARRTRSCVGDFFAAPAIRPARHGGDDGKPISRKPQLVWRKPLATNPKISRCELLTAHDAMLSSSCVKCTWYTTTDTGRFRCREYRGLRGFARPTPS